MEAKTDILRFTETEKDLLTNCNVFSTSSEDTFYRYLKILDSRVWKPRFEERENGNHLYILERIKPMQTPDPDTTFMNDGNDFVKFLKYLAIGLLAVSIMGYYIYKHLPY